MSLFFVLLITQAALGGIDNFWHHEITERLPSKRSASTELALHGAREFLYGFLFLALAWYQWHGGWTLLIAVVLLAEIAITLADFVVEDRTRRLPAFERVLHTVLALNFGMALAVLAPVLLAWWRTPSSVTPVHYGAVAWVLTVFACGVLVWSVRNSLAALKHRRPPEWVRNPLARGSALAPLQILVSGATGFIGGHLVRRLISRGDSVIVLTRDADRALNRFGPHVRVVTDLQDLSPDTLIDAVINLAGARILGIPWTRRRRQTLIDSRVSTTRALVNLSSRLQRPPRVFVTASAIGYYGVHADEPIDEQGEPQALFQSELCQRWEQAAAAVEALGARLVKLRIGLVLGRDGGALPSLALPVRLGVGAILGTGRQWMSWIHLEDLVRLIEFAIDKPALRGPVNAVSPNPVTHREFQQTLARSLRRPIWLRIPAFAPRAALGEMSQLLLEGQRVLPARAATAGFKFRYPNLRAALDELLGGRSSLARSELTEIYYNGQCTICNAEMSHYAQLCARTQPSLTFTDATQRPGALSECGLRGDHLERRIYLKDASGRVVSGIPALVQLWSRIPRYRWLARLAGAPVLRHVAAAAYDFLIAPTLAHRARRPASRASLRR